jgi:hypothetical protein
LAPKDKKLHIKRSEIIQLVIMVLKWNMGSKKSNTDFLKQPHIDEKY